MKRLLSVALVVLLCTLTLLPTFSVAVGAKERELVQYRSENSRTYALPEGGYRTDVYGIDQYFYDENAKLVEIDNTIVRAKQEGARYQNASNSYVAAFADFGGTEAKGAADFEDMETKEAADFGGAKAKGALVSLSAKSTTLSYTPIGDGLREAAALTSAEYARETKKDSESKELCEFEATLLRDPRTVWYPSLLPNVDYVYTCLADGVKEDLIFRNADVPEVFSFDVNLKGLSLSIEEDGVYFTNENGVQIFEMLPPFMEDAEGKASGNLKFDFEKKDEDTYRLNLYVDRAFLSRKDIVYPVRLDPTFVTKGSSMTSDTYTSSSNPWDNYGLSNYLRTGRDAPYGIRRSYIRFKLPSGYRSTGITAATLSLTLHSKGSNALTTFAHESLGYWKSTQLVYRSSQAEDKNSPAYNKDAGYRATVSGNTYTFDVWGTVLGMYGYSGRSNWGFVIADWYETDMNTWGTFYSSDCGDIDKVPKLSITYDDIKPRDAYFPGTWSGIPTTLSGYTQDSGSYVSSAFGLWNGITSKIGFGSLSTSNPSAKIRIYNQTNAKKIAPNVYAWAQNFDANENDTWSGTWAYSEIHINKRDNSIFVPLHNDLKEEIVAHELGHVLGLQHYKDTRCLMSEYGRYAYPMVTSHDKQVLIKKYGS